MINVCPRHGKKALHTVNVKARSISELLRKFNTVHVNFQIVLIDTVALAPVKFIIFSKLNVISEMLN